MLVIGEVRQHLHASLVVPGKMLLLGQLPHQVAPAFRPLRFNFSATDSSS